LNYLNKKPLFCLVFTFLCFAVSAESRWASAEINVRTGPGTSYDIMGQLYKNEKLEVFNMVNGWAQILFENVEGYVSSDLLLLEPIKSSAEEVTAELENAKQGKERLKSRIIHIVIIAAAILGVIIILKTV
jgi:uncharacterized protein YgiM (DUF1202 family)